MLDKDKIKCPYCRELIFKDAIKCRYCSTMLTSEEQLTEKITSDTKVKLTLSNKYEIIRQIGKGGMATVYEAIQKNLNRKVALKIIHLNLIHDEEFLSRFHREAQLAASLDHPNIVTVHDEGKVNDVHYMSMQFLSVTMRASCSAARSTIRCKVSRSKTVPVGLLGSFTMIIRVLAVNRRASSSGSG